ncbi:AAA-like domain-containing protein [Phormidium sp. CCY1219]|uniref:AAA-like domain-containing protein n=1 Tax=Phormidium sp. CCY1219 TaxID=2886104 RepID=UPI002D1F544A|nr:AAA-like domain-containing protein [Phormidium sp. CCY1219]MEB3831419.1 AAA-like domain-containing protein [Phormidium sp. CCY1219]
MLEKEINFEEAFKVADEAIFAQSGKHISDIEMKIFRGAWQDKTYEQIAENTEYAANYLHRMVGKKFWDRLSDALGEKVSKKNFKTALQRRWQMSQESVDRSFIATPTEAIATPCLEFSEGTVPLNSPFYVQRHPIEERCQQAIAQPGALLRIKAPQQMGKTSVLDRILDRARNANYRTVTLSFDLADSTVFTDLRKFLQWFCASVGQLCGLPNKLSEYWDDIFGCNNNTTVYFEEYILPESTTPLVLALDKVDVVFEHPEIASDFCRLLRAWYDIARRSDRRGAIWKQLRLIVVHSTEVYSGLDINHSPLANLGAVVSLPEFTPAQVQDLAKRYGLEWESDTELQPLLDIIGGHPYLVRKAFDYLYRNRISFLEFAAIAATEAGPFGDHLRQHLWNLQHHPELAAAFRDVVMANKPVKISSERAFKLYSMGLVQLQDNNVTPRFELYRQYFSVRLALT